MECKSGLQTQCRVTQVREHDMGAAIFGYSQLYGQVPGGQAEYLRVPHANYGPIKVPHGPPDDTFVYLSDVLPTAWQAVQYASVPPGGSLAVIGLGPIGDMATRIARYLGIAQVVGVDLVPERLARVAARGVDTIDLNASDDIVQEIRERFDGRGPHAVIDAVGMEAHGSHMAKAAQAAAGMTPDVVGEFLLKHAGVDRLGALNLAIDVVRRGGTISVVGVYGGMLDPLPMLKMFDKQLQLRMGQANVRRWSDDLLPLVTDDADPLGVQDFATHRLPLSEAPAAYASFQAKTDGAVKVLLQP
jgi:threonine dehydrogenase-like Zn-dependent dehydrogenase